MTYNYTPSHYTEVTASNPWHDYRQVAYLYTGDFSKIVIRRDGTCSCHLFKVRGAEACPHLRDLKQLFGFDPAAQAMEAEAPAGDALDELFRPVAATVDAD